MSVRQALLALLEEGPMYGYQLRSEFERRTGATWPLNVGQVYTTLTRLERDGLVTESGADGEGHVVYEVTDAGREAVEEATAALNRDVFATPGLPGVDVRELTDRLTALRTGLGDSS